MAPSDDWAVTCIHWQMPELGRLARNFARWQAEFLDYFSTGRISNGPTEAVNLLIKKTLRVGHGFRDFANYRLCLLLHCGITWRHHTPTPRGVDAGGSYRFIAACTHWRGLGRCLA